jgi:hypothetical protein
MNDVIEISGGINSITSTVISVPTVDLSDKQSTAINYIGKIISNIEIDIETNKCIITFFDNIKIIIEDERQCCEKRYISSDDDLSSLNGYELYDIISKYSSNTTNFDDEDEIHEICFVEIVSSGGCITLVNHNIHNGYYGGFALSIKQAPIDL